MLLGHSAGAQFLDRVAASGAPDAARIVIANSSTCVMPSTAEAERRGWAFGWRLVEAPGVGHDAGRMFASPGAVGAVQGTR
ncbi:hypothetical protein ACV229_03495 [Burkholderia sp. MR1-5-21]